MARVLCNNEMRAEGNIEYIFEDFEVMSDLKFTVPALSTLTQVRESTLVYLKLKSNTTFPKINQTVY